MEPHYFNYSKGQSLSEIEHEILAFLIKDSHNETASSIRAVAKQLTTSTATIIRLCKKLGFSGYTEFAQQLRLDHLKQHPTVEMQQLNTDFTVSYQRYLADYQATLTQIDLLQISKFKELLAISPLILIVPASQIMAPLADYLKIKLQLLGYHALVSLPQETLLGFNEKLAESGLIILLTEAPLEETILEKLQDVQARQIPIAGFYSSNLSLSLKPHCTMSFELATTKTTSTESSSFASNLLAVLDLLLSL